MLAVVENSSSPSKSREMFSGLRARGLALLLTLSTPAALTFLSSCSREEAQAAVKPNYSSLVVNNSSDGIQLSKVPGRLASLGQLHGPLQEALVAMVAFGDMPELQEGKKIVGAHQPVLDLKNALINAHRALANAGNEKELSSIVGEILQVSTLVSSMMQSISTDSNINEYWNPEILDSRGQMKGVDLAINTQSALEKMVGALDEDMAALIPGFELSRVVYFSEVIGGAKQVVTDIGEILSKPERDQAKLDELKVKLSQSITILDAVSKEPELVKLGAGTKVLLGEMLKLHTGLAKNISDGDLKVLQTAATKALENTVTVEKETTTQLASSGYSGGGGGYFFYPHYHHWFYTGHASSHSSWNGASGFRSTSRFSSSNSLAKTGVSSSSVKSTSSGFKSGSSFGRAPSSGFKAGGFGGTGRSFGGVGVS